MGCSGPVVSCFAREPPAIFTNASGVLWSLDIPFERPGQRSVQLHAVAVPRTGAWRLSAAVGGMRSIAPGFSRVETAQIQLSPCSGRQAADGPWTTRTSAWVEVLVDVSLSPAT